MRRNTFMQLVQAACISKDIEDDGPKFGSTTFGLRSTFVKYVFEHDHPVSSVSTCAGLGVLNGLKTCSIGIYAAVLICNNEDL